MFPISRETRSSRIFEDFQSHAWHLYRFKSVSIPLSLRPYPSLQLTRRLSFQHFQYQSEAAFILSTWILAIFVLTGRDHFSSLAAICQQNLFCSLSIIIVSSLHQIELTLP